MMKLAVLATILILAAGCADAADPSSGAGPGPSTGGSGSGSTATASGAPGQSPDETGSVLVMVSDTELAPIEGAQVEVKGADLTAFTDASGTATFNGLYPGSYTVLVAKPGYKAQHDKGKVVEVIPGETAEVKMLLDPIQLIDADNSYHRTLPFRAFISCAIEGAPGMILGRSTPCGQWLNPGGVQLGDPNHKSRFQWTVDSVQISGIVAEAKWQPATGVTAQQLRLVVTHQVDCAATCLWQNALLTFGGPSPLNGKVLQAPDNRITKRWGEDPAAYPKQVYFEVGSYCATNCQGAQVVWQQNVDMYLTAFYGLEPVDGFSAMPK